jgi:ABC-type glycerol-3-phosphate transport system substrate-binding protein
MKKITKIAAVTGAALLTITACSAATSDTSTTTPDTQSSISTGLGTKDATADVKLGKSTEEYGFTTLPVKITNNSEKASDYYIEVVAESKDGSERIDFSNVFVSGLKPGQKATEEAMFTEDIPASAVFVVTEVQRTAS